MTVAKFVSMLQEENKDPRVKIIGFDIKDIEVEERVRLRCMIPPCPNYGRNKLCPPNLPDMEFIRKALSRYQGGALVVLSLPYHEGLVNEIKQAKPQNELMGIIGRFEKIAFMSVNHLAFGLTVGGCKLCGECPPGSEPCLKPLEAHPGVNGFGIDITTLARKLGVNVEWPIETEVNFMGLIFI